MQIARRVGRGEEKNVRIYRIYQKREFLRSIETTNAHRALCASASLANSTRYSAQRASR